MHSCLVIALYGLLCIDVELSLSRRRLTWARVWCIFSYIYHIWVNFQLPTANLPTWDISLFAWLLAPLRWAVDVSPPHAHTQYFAPIHSRMWALFVWCVGGVLFGRTLCSLFSFVGWIIVIIVIIVRMLCELLLLLCLLRLPSACSVLLWCCRCRCWCFGSSCPSFGLLCSHVWSERSLRVWLLWCTFRFYTFRRASAAVRLDSFTRQLINWCICYAFIYMKLELKAWKMFLLYTLCWSYCI